MDTLGNLITSIRNAEMANHSELLVPASRQAEAVLAILQKNSYISGFHRIEGKPSDSISIKLANRPHEYKRISKPGRRMYVTADSIPVVKQGHGMVIISTSQGVMSGNDAKEKGLGGELIASVSTI
jgi:small subunit ribosomal protein S8